MRTYREPGAPRIRDYALGFVAVLLIAAAGLAAFGLEWRFGGTSAIAFWMWFFIGGLGLLAPTIRWVHRYRFQAAQPARDKAALEAALNHPGSYCLYLRPFSSTGKLPLTLRHVEYAAGIPGYQSRSRDVEKIDLETELARALSPHVSLVALGKPGEFRGAGRVKASEANWQAVIGDLARGALAIFAVPARNSGTRWELDFILGDATLREKTLLIVPPLEILDWTGRPRFSGSIETYERLIQRFSAHRDRVEAAVDPHLDALLALKSIGIPPKPFDHPGGSLIRLSAPEQFAPIAEYERVSGGGLSSKRGVILRFGLRNAIYRLHPALAARLQMSNAPD